MAEQIDIEVIMNEIRTEIRKNNKLNMDKEFRDISCLDGGLDLPFDLTEFVAEVNNMDGAREVNSYRDISSKKKVVGAFVTFFRKVVRRLTCFYIEPIVDDQNKFNETTTKAVGLTIRKHNENDSKIDELEKRLYECEARIRELESLLVKYDNQGEQK